MAHLDHHGHTGNSHVTVAGRGDKDPTMISFQVKEALGVYQGPGAGAPDFKVSVIQRSGACLLPQANTKVLEPC